MYRYIYILFQFLFIPTYFPSARNGSISCVVPKRAWPPLFGLRLLAILGPENADGMPYIPS